ncbi:MAG: hypothetical protein DHS20C04_29950 [Hyphococcus sp.]|nr:MAG: hypothetical protein DHS20C04_29950 [Marinicaulis sp.]
MYQEMLGEAFDALPDQIRLMHSGVHQAVGRADIRHGSSPLSKLICALAKMPASGEDLPVETSFEPLERGERWIRNFNGQTFATELRIKSAGEHPEATESFGPFAFRLRIVAHEHGVDMIPEGVKLLGLPLPRFLCPEALGLERVRDGKYHFDVTVRFPLAGDVIIYSGWLEPAA